MKKIMFNDKYGLTRAVLDGRKTMTRRVIKPQYETIKAYNANCETYILGELDGETFEVKPCYYIGEVVAIAQNYQEAINEFNRLGDISGWGNLIANTENGCAGYYNKMFVRADLMPHRIRITDLKVERLQDISDEDCLKEGVKQWTRFTYRVDGIYYDFIDPREAFAALIDKVSGRGTWDRNPWVFAYSFELVK